MVSATALHGWDEPTEPPDLTSFFQLLSRPPAAEAVTAQPAEPVPASMPASGPSTSSGSGAAATASPPDCAARGPALVPSSAQEQDDHFAFGIGPSPSDFRDIVDEDPFGHGFWEER